jgi:hypothetical protein
MLNCPKKYIKYFSLRSSNSQSTTNLAGVTVSSKGMFHVATCLDGETGFVLNCGLFGVCGSFERAI